MADLWNMKLFVVPPLGGFSRYFLFQDRLKAEHEFISIRIYQSAPDAGVIHGNLDISVCAIQKVDALAFSRDSRKRGTLHKNRPVVSFKTTIGRQLPLDGRAFAKNCGFPT